MKIVHHAAAIGTTALALMLVMSGTGRAADGKPSNTATIEVSVPADAKVWFDDNPTNQSGPQRTFESPPLTPGKTYEYVITAQWRGPDGKDVVRKQQVSVRANQGGGVEFTPRVQPTYTYSGYYTTEPGYYYTTQPGYYSGCCADYYSGCYGDYGSGYYGGRRGLFSGYYRVGNVLINGRRWGDIGYRYSHADLIRW
jgi:uncharacterized protein (TIGR03000 family)